MSWTDFLPEFPPVNRCTFTVSNSAHGKVFIPVSMVEPDEKIVESSVAKNSVGAKHVFVGAGVVNGNTGQVALMNEQMLATELGPVIAGEISMEEQLELMRGFKNDKAQNLQSGTSQDPCILHNFSIGFVFTAYSALGDLTAQLVVGSAVIIPKSNPPMCGTIRWIGTIPPVHDEHIAGVELVRLAACSCGLHHNISVTYNIWLSN